jgi:hypothetical protein
MLLTRWQRRGVQPEDASATLRDRPDLLGLRWLEIEAEKICALIGTQPRIGDIVFASRSAESIVGYRKMWTRIAKLGDLSSDTTQHVLRRSFNEPTIAPLLGYKTHSISR